MSEYYQPYYSPAAGAGGNPDRNHQDAQQYPHHIPMPVGGDAHITHPYQNLHYFTGFPDPIMFQPPKAQGSRNRRKTAPGLDHVKHRRTRSGCYTCRSRRVKCDETHPICERCRKGKRECVYPESPASKASAGPSSSKDAASNSQSGSPTSSADEVEEEADKDIKLEPIPDEEEPEEPYQHRMPHLASLRRTSAGSTLNLQRTGTRQGSETPSLEGTKSSSPSVSTATSASFVTQFPLSDPSMQPAAPDWSHLPPDLRFYLEYFCDNMTHWSYCVVEGGDDFFRTFLPGVAVRSGNEGLLYAVVGFAAYHHTIQNPAGKIEDFLQYYNKSVTLLLNSFKRHERQTTVTLLTILQLATIEEYLGDWVNLLGHQRAALQILMRLFTPQTAMQTAVTRMIMTWYVRFDVITGMMGGFETRLPREWCSTAMEYYESQVAKEPNDLSWKTEACSASLRLISVDMSILYAKAGRGEMAGEAFVTEHTKLTSKLYEWRHNMDPALTDRTSLVTDFKHKTPLKEGDIVDPYKQGYLYEPPLFSTTILLAEWHSIILMHRSQEPSILQQEPSPELTDLALAICQIFESLERWPWTPNGTLTTLQACMSIAALFIPRDGKHYMWMRRKFATIEARGYVYPLTLRTRMAEIFRDPACIRWWLPQDEGLSPVLRNVRAFADERNAGPVSQQTESLREMSAIFAKMRMDYEGTPSPIENPSSSGFLRGKGRDASG